VHHSGKVAGAVVGALFGITLLAVLVFVLFKAVLNKNRDANMRNIWLGAVALTAGGGMAVGQEC
jgi:hypothetical protein